MLHNYQSFIWKTVYKKTLSCITPQIRTLHTNKNRIKTTAGKFEELLKEQQLFRNMFNKFENMPLEKNILLNFPGFQSSKL